MTTTSLFSGIENILPGQVINERWKVGAKSSSTDPNSTGGFFSVTFDCTDLTTGKPVFLKVVDVLKAINLYSSEMSISDVLLKIGEEHKFESNLMNECKEARLRRVVVALDSGDTRIPNYEGPVMYLVFELAKGDTHKIRDIAPELSARGYSDKWWLDTLHCVATGLNQLHSKMIAHQDVKPSNILFFERLEAKVADLGRAVKRGQNSSTLKKNGDRNHSPPEVLYGMRATEWGVRYLSVDLYMLGNLLYFHFSSGMPVTHAILDRLEPVFCPFRNPGVRFADALPALQEAFGRVVLDFRENLVGHLPAKVADGLTTILVELCQPDPEKRGHPRDHAIKHGPTFSTVRYISRFKGLRHLIP